MTSDVVTRATLDAALDGLEAVIDAAQRGAQMSQTSVGLALDLVDTLAAGRRPTRQTLSTARAALLAFQTALEADRAVVDAMPAVVATLRVGTGAVGES